MTLKSGDVFFSEHGKSVVIPESISLFGFTVSFYGICLVLGALAGIAVTLNELRKQKKDEEQILAVMTLVIVAALFGSRFYYVIFNWHIFAEKPISVFNLRSGGLTYYGALLGAWLAAKLYCRKKMTGFGEIADGLCVGASAAAVLVWLGCVFEREPLGRFYDGPFSVRISSDYVPDSISTIGIKEILSRACDINGDMQVSVHPVAVYGIVLNILILLCILFVRRYIRQSGGVFTLYLLLNGISCLILEYFRADRCFIWGTTIPVNYVVSLVLVAVIAAGHVRHYIIDKNLKNRFRRG